MKLSIVNIQPTGQCPPWGFFDWSSGSKVTKIISRTGRLISNSRDRTSIYTLNKICAKFGGPIYKRLHNLRQSRILESTTVVFVSCARFWKSVYTPFIHTE
eukprot:sb/3478502/